MAKQRFPAKLRQALDVSWTSHNRPQPSHRHAAFTLTIDTALLPTAISTATTTDRVAVLSPAPPAAASRLHVATGPRCSIDDSRGRPHHHTSAAAPAATPGIHVVAVAVAVANPRRHPATVSHTSHFTMLPQGPLQAGSPPTTFLKAYYPGDNAPAPQPTAFTQGQQTSHDDAVRISRYNNNLGSTAKGIMIGIFSVLGAAGVCLIIAAIVYYFRYTSQGRIFLDRISRPGEYDDEQQFAKEEAEALEDMDDLQRTEYMRAKGRHITLNCEGYHIGIH